MVAQRADAGMGRHDRRARQLGRLQHRCLARHARRRPACRAGSSPRSPRGPSGDSPPCSVSRSPRSARGLDGIGQRVVAVMGQRHVARAELAKRRQPGQVAGRRRSRSPRRDDREDAVALGRLDLVGRGGAAGAPVALRPWRGSPAAWRWRGRRRRPRPPACGGPAAHRRRSSRRPGRRAASSADRRGACRPRRRRGRRPGDVDMGVEGEQAAVQVGRIGHARTVGGRRAFVKSLGWGFEGEV